VKTRIFRRMDCGPYLISIQLSLSEKKAETTRQALDLLKADAAQTSDPRATFSWVLSDCLIREANKIRTFARLPLIEGEP
jgi:hypothetical protein